MTLPLERHWKNVGWALCVEAFWGIFLVVNGVCDAAVVTVTVKVTNDMYNILIGGSGTSVSVT